MKHLKKFIYDRDNRGNKEAFINYCKKYLSFIDIDKDTLIANSIEAYIITDNGLKENKDIKFNEPKSVDDWVDWWVENEEVSKPKLTYSEYLKNM